MSTVGHVHQWRKPAVYRDFCHYTVVEKTCKECGFVQETTAVRDFGLNPLQVAFADFDCADCREALKGFEPDSWKHSCSACGCDLNEHESGRCSVCYAADLALP